MTRRHPDQHNHLVWAGAVVGLLAGACQGTLKGDAPPNGLPPGAAGSGGAMGGAGSAGGGMPTQVSASDCKAPGIDDAGVGRWRRLTTAQYRNTISDLLGVPVDNTSFLQDSKTGSFATNADLPPQSGDIDAYQATAERLAAAAVLDLPALLAGCDLASAGEDECAGAFILDFGARAYRHSLTERQKTALTQVYQVGKAESFAKGIQLVIEATLQSPEFVYVVELGKGSGPLLALDDYELANRLSYSLSDSMPDAELFAKAQSGALTNPVELMAQAERLLHSERYLRAASSFHEQLFRVERLTQSGVVTKSPEHELRFDDAMRSAMVAEAEAFIVHLFGQGGGTIKQLLSAPLAFAQGPLAQIYGLNDATAAQPTPIVDGTRAGFLTLPAVMASVPPLPTRHQAVMRGNMIRRELLCDLVPPPNVAVNFMLPPNADQLSNQELLRAHKDNPSCSGCHELMDPIGFGFESYDGLGQYLTSTPQGDVVDTRGYVQGLDGGRVEFNGAAELAQQLGASNQVRSCLATQWFRFALARDPHAGDECSLSEVDKVMTAGDGDIRAALVALVQSPAFRFRKVQ